MNITTKIYTLSEPDTNEVRYIGKSNNPKKRFYKHCVFNSKNTHKNNWINKLLRENKKPVLEIIDEVPLEEWSFWETYWIVQFRAWGFNLTNSSDGGEGSVKGNKTSFRKGQTAWNKGVPVSNSTKEKLRQANLGKKQSEQTKNKKNDKLKGRKVKDLSKIINNGLNTRFEKGFTPWNKNKKGHSLGGLKKAKEVFQFSLEDKFIAEYKSCEEASKKNNCSREMIRACCVGKYSKSCGFKWKYK